MFVLMGSLTQGGGHPTFYSGRGVRPGFPKCGNCELIFTSEIGVLWTEILKFRGLKAKIWANFLKRGSCELTCLKWDPCKLGCRYKWWKIRTSENWYRLSVLQHSWSHYCQFFILTIHWKPGRLIVLLLLNSCLQASQIQCYCWPERRIPKYNSPA